MSFFRKMQKELEQKSNSESQNNQPIIEFLQSTATSDTGRVDMQVISDFVSSEKSPPYCGESITTISQVDRQAKVYHREICSRKW